MTALTADAPVVPRPGAVPHHPAGADHSWADHHTRAQRHPTREDLR